MLNHYGVRGKTSTWINSFLVSRTQQVALEGKQSSTAPVTQCWTLYCSSATLMIFLNDYHQHLFADDCLLYRVTIVDRLTWNEHVDTMVNKTNSTNVFLQCNINSYPRNIKEVCYSTFVRPTVEYADTVWEPASARNILGVE